MLDSNKLGCGTAWIEESQVRASIIRNENSCRQDVTETGNFCVNYRQQNKSNICVFEPIQSDLTFAG